MTVEIALALGILLLAIIFFVTEILRADLVALLVLVLLVIVGLVSPEESISGFSNPAVVTTWAVLSSLPDWQEPVWLSGWPNSCCVWPVVHLRMCAWQMPTAFQC